MEKDTFNIALNRVFNFGQVIMNIVIARNSKIGIIGLLVMLTSCNTNRQMDKSKVFEFLNPKSIGIDFENNLTYTEEFNTYLFRSFYNGAGVGMADLNNDGFQDLFFCGNQVENKLYLGDGKFNFKDVTTIAGVASLNAWSTGVSIVDIDQDGLLDIYVCKSGNPSDKNRRNELFMNKGIDDDGIPVFKEEAKAFGIDDLGFSVHAVFLDFDKDGDLDMYLSNNSIEPSDLVIDVKKGIRDIQDTDGGDKLYRNDGNRFTNVNKDAGIYSSVIGFGLGISVADLNRDTWPDIYVANDFFEKDYLYMNNGDGTFTESIEQVAQELSLGSMGVDIADMNHDGYPEIFVTEMLPDTEDRLKTKAFFDNWDKYQLKLKNGYYRQFPRNVFQLNNGIGSTSKISFSEISRYANVSATDWSWGVQMVDFDLDGKNEIFVTNGIPKDLLDQDYIDFYNDPSKVREILIREGEVIKRLIDDIPTQPLSNYMFKESRNLKFENVAKAWGLDQPSFSSGSAYGDIDNDGDLDLVVNNIDAPPFIYRNTSSENDNAYLVIDLKDQHGAPAIGAQVSMIVNEQKYFKELYPMRGVMSVVDSRLNYGLGNADTVDSLIIEWPNGNKIIETNIAANQFLTLIQSEKSYVRIDSTQINRNSMLVLDSTTMIPKAKHIESEYVDFNNEKLLYQMVSNEGPKIATADINGDGKEDFFFAGAKGQSGALYVQAKEGFSRSTVSVFKDDELSEDTDAIFFDADGDTDLDLLVATGSPEFSTNSFALIDHLYLNDGQGTFTKSEQLLPNGRPNATSVVINADFDADGDQDLFFGGRLVPGSYGVPSSSYILENDGKGNYQDVTQSIAPGLKELGMVTDAVWSDYDSDGDFDIIIAGHWMPIRVFENSAGKFNEVTDNVGLKNTNGFWNALEVKDLNNDGYQDIIAGNLGENSFFTARPEKPVSMYVNDFDQNGDVEQIITTYRGDKAYPIAQKKELTAQLPYLLKKYLKYSDYKEQTVEDIFSTEQLEHSLKYQVNTTSSTIFWNRNGQFVEERLPFETQLTPIYAIWAGNIDHDKETVEIITTGNQYRAKPQTGIYAAGYGNVMQVRENSKIKALNSKTSGLHIEGEVRDIKKLNISDKDYIVFARNNDTVQVYAIKN